MFNQVENVVTTYLRCVESMLPRYITNYTLNANRYSCCGYEVGNGSNHSRMQGIEAGANKRLNNL